MKNDVCNTKAGLLIAGVVVALVLSVASFVMSLQSYSGGCAAEITQEMATKSIGGGRGLTGSGTTTDSVAR